MKTSLLQTAGPVRDWVKTPSGELVLVDELNHRVLLQSADGHLRVAANGFRYPRSVAVLESVAYVVDSWNHRVKAFELPGWNPAFDFGSFFCPSWISVFSVGRTGQPTVGTYLFDRYLAGPPTPMNNLLVVADTNNRRLSFHEPNGSSLFTYALDGFPKRVGTNSNGRLVVDYDNGDTETLTY